MMNLGDRAALLRQAAAAMDELKRLCQAEGGHGHTVTCCERMAEACRDAALDAEELAEALAVALAAEDDADGEAGTT
jgi:hypothetical protein